MRRSEVEVELLRRLRRDALHLVPPLALDLVVEHVRLQSGKLDALVGVGSGLVRLAGALDREIEPVAGLLVDRLTGTQVHAGEIESRVESQRAVAGGGALGVRNQRHRGTGRLRQLPGHGHLDRSEIDAHLECLRRLRPAAAHGEPDRTREHLSQGLAQRRVVGGEPGRVEIVRDDLQPFDPRRRRGQTLGAPVTGDSRGPHIQLELVDADVAGRRIALQVGVQRDVELLATLRGREPQAREFYGALHRGGARSAGNGRAELRVEIRIQGTCLQAHVLADERSEWPDVDGRIHVQSHAGRRRRQRRWKRSRLHPDLEVLLVRQHRRLEEQDQRSPRAEVIDGQIEMLDRQLLRAARRLVDECDLPVEQRRMVHAQEREIGLLLVLRLRLGVRGQLLLEALQIRRAVAEPLDVHGQPLHLGRTDLHVLARGKDGAQQRHPHFGALQVDQRHLLAGSGPDLHVRDAHSQAGEELGRDASDLHGAAPLLRHLLRLLLRLCSEDAVEHERNDDDHYDENRNRDAADLLPSLHRAGNLGTCRASCQPAATWLRSRRRAPAS